MRVTTRGNIAGWINEETLGRVHGSAMWEKPEAETAGAGSRRIQPSTMEILVDGLNAVKAEAEVKAKLQATELGADAIVDLRLEVYELSDGTFTAVASGTAVRISALPNFMPGFAPAANDDDYYATPYMPKPKLRLVSNQVH